MTPEAVLSHLTAVLAEIAPDVDLGLIDPSEPFRDEADLDSMDVLRMLRGIEARTGLSVPDADLRQLLTLDQLVAYLGALPPPAG